MPRVRKHKRDNVTKMKLSFDVLIYILRSLEEPSDISRASRTCRDLHRAGIVALLKRPDGVYIEDGNRFGSFADFMSADAGRRVPLLKKLVLDYCFERNFIFRVDSESNIGEHSVELARILACCTHLESLSITDGLNARGDGTSILDKDTRIGVALTQLEHLQVLHIGQNVDTIKSLPSVLAHMRSACTQISLEYRPDLYDMRREPAADPNVILERFASSLEVLRLNRPTFTAKTITYTNLTTLELYNWQQPLISHVLYAFPNLRRLLLSHNLPSSLLARRRNLDTFHLHPWKELDWLRGGILDLHILGIECAIRRWEILGKLSGSLQDRVNLHELIVVLQSIRVERLLLHFHVDTAYDLSAFFDVLVAQTSSTLTHLKLYLDLEQETEEEVELTLETLGGYARNLGLVYFALDFRWKAYIRALTFDRRDWIDHAFERRKDALRKGGIPEKSLRMEVERRMALEEENDEAKFLERRRREEQSYEPAAVAARAQRMKEYLEKMVPQLPSRFFATVPSLKYFVTGEGPNATCSIMEGRDGLEPIPMKVLSNDATQRLKQAEEMETVDMKWAFPGAKNRY